MLLPSNTIFVLLSLLVSRLVVNWGYRTWIISINVKKIFWILVMKRKILEIGGSSSISVFRVIRFDFLLIWWNLLSIYYSFLHLSFQSLLLSFTLLFLLLFLTFTTSFLFFTFLQLLFYLSF